MSWEGVATDHAKIEAMKSFPMPKSVKEVRSFTGLAMYYWKFIPSYLKVARPLHDLTKKGVLFN